MVVKTLGEHEKRENRTYHGKQGEQNRINNKNPGVCTKRRDGTEVKRDNLKGNWMSSELGLNDRGSAQRIKLILK